MQLATLEEISVYPIKGLSGLALEDAAPIASKGLEGDRRFALTLNPDVDGSVWKSSRTFLINAVNDGLLQFKLRKENSCGTLTASDGSSLSVSLDDPSSLDAFNEHLPALLSSIVDPALKVRLVRRGLQNGPPAHWDYPDSQLLLINMEAIRLVEKVTNLSIDARRFRANLIVSGMAAWNEFSLAGSRFLLGASEIEFTRPARRCAAICVNPDSGERDIDLHKRLNDKFGHAYFGIYGRVVKSGCVKTGHKLELLGHSKTTHSDAQVEGGGHYALWPKSAEIMASETTANGMVLTLRSNTPWPLIESSSGVSLKVYLGADQVEIAQILDFTDTQVSILLNDNLDTTILPISSEVIVSGPFGR